MFSLFRDSRCFRPAKNAKQRGAYIPFAAFNCGYRRPKRGTNYFFQKLLQNDALFSIIIFNYIIIITKYRHFWPIGCIGGNAMVFISGSLPVLKQVIRDGADFLKDNVISRIKEVENDDGSVTLRAKATDRFQFVMRPEVTVDPAVQQVVSCRCDCERGRTALCRHVAALLLSVGEQIEPVAAPTAPAASASSAEPARGEITIRVIHQGKGYASQETFLTTTGTQVDVVEPEAPAAAIKPTEEPAEPEPTAKEPGSADKPEAQEEAPAEEAAFTPPGIQVLFGTKKYDDEPVIWCPNDTEQVMHPNMGIIGTMGTGKTQFTKSLIYQIARDRAANFNSPKLGILIFDYKGDYNETKTDFVNATNARVLKPYRLPYNPLALVEPRTFKPLLPIHTANAFKDTVSKIYRLGPKQQQFLLDCIRKAYAERGIRTEDPATWKKRAPTIADVYRVYNEEVGDSVRDSLTAALNKLNDFRIFDDSPISSGSLLDLMDGVVVLDLSGYDQDIQSLVVAITLDQFYAQMMNLGSSATDGHFRELRELIVVDEADNFMMEDFPALKKILKEGREFGVGTVLSTQSLSHFIGGEDDYSRYILTWVVHAAADLKQKDIEYVFKLPPKSAKTAAIYATVKSLEKHQSVIKISNDAPQAVVDLPFWKLLKEE